jgi:WS/DGAT/MGAT family acyltransferase
MHEYSTILGPVDSAFYYVERPEMPMNIGALAIFDGILDFDELMKHIEARLHLIPRYRDRVVQAPLNLGQPTWIADPDFYIGNHMMRVCVDPPANEAELRKLVGNLLSRTLDRSKPLWELHFIEGLNDQTALFFKVHHCMVDGLAAVDLFMILLDTDKEASSEPIMPRPLYDPIMLPNPIELTLDSLLRDVSHQFNLLRKLGKETLRMGSILTDREKRLKMLVAFAHLVNNNLQPIKKLPINGRNSGIQTMFWAEFPLDKIHAIRALCAATVNDVMLVLLTRAVERYIADHGGTDQPFLRILVPINVRNEAEKGEYGNRISVLPIDVPFNVLDPLEHLKAVTRFSKVMKESALAYSFDMLLTLPALLPAPAQQPIWNIAPSAFSFLAHTWCTNVAALPIPVFLLGHELNHVYGYFPLNSSMGLASVIVSYNGRITMTLLADQGIVKDADVLERYLKESFDDFAHYLPEPQPSQSLSGEFTRLPPSNGVVKQKEGSSSRHWIVPAVTTPVVPIEQPAPLLTRERFKLFSEGWAKAMQEEIRHSEDYRSVSTRWTAGSLAFVMEAASAHGFDAPAAVWFDLDRGICRSARAMSIQEAMREAAFVIQGGYTAWIDVLSGKGAPLLMLTNGRLKLKKGALFSLLPHTRSATELVRCAQRVPWQ